MKIPTVLYHATSEEAWKSIQKMGLIDSMTGVYMTDDLKAAQYFARGFEHGVILAVETTHLDPDLIGQYEEMLCRILNTTPFWHHYGDIPKEYVSKLQLRKVTK